MNDHDGKNDRRAEARTDVDRFYSVEVAKNGMRAAYRFKIRNISSKGMCILVKEDSKLLEHLVVGDILDLKYYSLESKGPVDQCKTEIIHITNNTDGKFKGHCLVGLAIVG